MKEQASKLYGYNSWANDTMFAHLKTLPSDLMREPIQSVFPTVMDALVHVCRVDNVWMHALLGDSMEVTMSSIERLMTEVREKTLQEMQGLYHDVAENYRMFIRENDMEGVREFPHPKYGVLKASNTEIVQHVVNHGTYHRGNVTAMLRQMGHAGAATDLVFYLFEA
jgi:uncharacterized damage-inducible protein DinB